MILEGIVTTLNQDGSVHIAAMGPEVEEEGQSIVLKPFQTSQTFRNLERHPEGVVHASDDVLLLAQAAIGKIDPMPAIEPARRVRGFYLSGCCRYWEFQVVSSDRSLPRARLETQVVHCGRVRDFFGFNRAKHAVVEAAILATRLHLIPLLEISQEFDRLEVLVQKTGGIAERQAFDLLRRHLVTSAQESKKAPSSDESAGAAPFSAGRRD